VPLLLLLPLLFVVLLVLWALLLPLALWQRYRLGRQRNRAVPWVVGFNAWAMLLSVLVFFFSSWIAGWWVSAALAYAAGGVAAGIVTGLAGLALTRFEHEPRRLYYTPNRWLVLGLTLLVAARIGYGMVRAWQAWNVDAHAAWFAQQGSVLAVGGLVLGYYLAYWWGLRRRVRSGSA
jgi:hypothetical protein